MSKQAELVGRPTRQMSKKEIQKHDAEIALVNKAFDVLDFEETRLEYNKKWRSLYGKKDPGHVGLGIRVLKHMLGEISGSYFGVGIG